MVSILIGGDLVPTKSNLNEFVSGDISNIISREIVDICKSADIRIFNLEVPLTNIIDPIAKCGPNLAVTTGSIAGIKRLDPSLISMANNHILDQNTIGLQSTINVLSENNIPTVGAGENLIEASKPFIFNIKKLRLGIYACTENEFSIATNSNAGANPFDPLESIDHIKRLKEDCDYVIVLYHGGREHYRYPTPYLQKVCRKMISVGADLVVCQHSHTIGCLERYLKGTILYGQGNFLFDYSENVNWQTSLLVKIDIDTSFDIDFIPIIKDKNKIKLPNSQNSSNILSDFISRSNDIMIEGYVESKYFDYVNNNFNYYLRSLSGFSNFITGLDKKMLNGFFINRIYSSEKLLRILNYIECESHRELVISGLKLRIKNVKKPRK